MSTDRESLFASPESSCTERVDAMLLNHITVGTRRQYAEQSRTWTHGHKTEDELLQRIWNLSGDSLAFFDALVATTARAERAEQGEIHWARQTEKYAARVEELEKAEREMHEMQDGS